MRALANVTASGIRIRDWLGRLAALLVSEGKHRFIGPAICDEDGTVLDWWKLNSELFCTLKDVQSDREDLIGGGMPHLPMSELYTEITQALATKLSFSKSL